MRGIVSLFVIGAALLSGSVHGKVPENLLPTEKEKTAFLDEADDFLMHCPMAIRTGRVMPCFMRCVVRRQSCRM